MISAYRYILLIPVILLALHTAHAKHTADVPFVVSGVISNSASARPIRHFVQYLGQQTGIKFSLVYADSYSRLSSIMRSHPVSLGWTCGAPYVEDARRDQQQLVAVPLFNNRPLYHSLIITSLNSQAKKLSDFKDKIFVFSDIRSNSGFLAPAVQLKKQGIDINNFFSLMINSGSHENSIVALLNGLADVAAIDEYVWVEYTRKHRQALKKLHEIERTGPYPFTPLVAAKGIDKETMDKIRNALLNISHTQAGSEILSQLGLDGFVIKSEEFYKPVQDMLDLMQ